MSCTDDKSRSSSLNVIWFWRFVKCVFVPCLSHLLVPTMRLSRHRELGIVKIKYYIEPLVSLCIMFLHLGLSTTNKVAIERILTIISQNYAYEYVRHKYMLVSWNNEGINCFFSYKKLVTVPGSKNFWKIQISLQGCSNFVEVLMK